MINVHPELIPSMNKKKTHKASKTKASLKKVKLVKKGSKILVSTYPGIQKLPSHNIQ